MGLDIAPAPVLLEQERYEHPIVVQTWLAGPVSGEPPRGLAEWEHLVQHYRTIHGIDPGAVATGLPRAVVTAARAQDGLERITREMARMPPEAHPCELRALVAQLACVRFPAWREPEFTLCRVDPNPLNFIRRPGSWASVDWENSGWVAPAFEIADLVAFPAYASVPAARWDWFVRACGAGRADPEFAVRVRVYLALTLVWWVAVSARARCEIARGLLERRLVERPAGWRESVPRQYERCLERARGALAELAQAYP